MRRSDVVRQSIRHKAMSLRRGVGGQPRAATKIHNGLGVSCAGNGALCVYLCVALMAHGQAWPKIRYTAGASSLSAAMETRVSLAAWVAESSLGHADSVHSRFWVFLHLRRKYACLHKRLYSYL
jgi:hypothetical protein